MTRNYSFGQFCFLSYFFQNQVQYDVRGILEKNRDTFRDDLLNLLRESRYVSLLPETSLASKVIFVQMLLITNIEKSNMEAARFTIIFPGPYFINKMTNRYKIVLVTVMTI